MLTRKHSCYIYVCVLRFFVLPGISLLFCHQLFLSLSLSPCVLMSDECATKAGKESSRRFHPLMVLAPSLCRAAPSLRTNKNPSSTGIHKNVRGNSSLCC